MKLALIAAAAFAAISLCACDPDNGEIDVTPDTAAENTGEQVGQAVEDTAKAVEKAGDDLEAAVKPDGK